MHDWTASEDARLVAYREDPKYSYSDIARMMNQWFETTEFTKDMCQKRAQVLAPPPPLPAAPEMMPNFRRYFDEDGQPLVTPPKRNLVDYLMGLALSDYRVEILHISDLHVDQHDEELLDQVLRRHASADLVVIAGDFLDIYAYSRFDKLKNRPIEGELENGVRLLEHISANFPHVVVIQSNHLDRVARSISVPTGLQFLVEPNLMRHLARPFRNVHTVEEFYVQIGDAIFSHADYTSGLAPQSALQVHKSLAAKTAVGYTDLRPWRVLVQAHTHRVGCTVTGGVKLIESGCLARLPLDYTTTAKSMRFSEPQANGYAVVVQRNGVSLVNECREHYLRGANARVA
jgi:hypothetical protein